jgi:fatty acid desaturase
VRSSHLKRARVSQSLGPMKGLLDVRNTLEFPCWQPLLRLGLSSTYWPLAHCYALHLLLGLWFWFTLWMLLSGSCGLQRGAQFFLSILVGENLLLP